MEPIIYQIARSDIIVLNKDSIYFDKNPSPKLIKFGFNNITEDLDLASLTSNSYYTVALNFDFNKKDKESITKLAQDKLGTKNFDPTFAEFWEIIRIFNLFVDNQTIISSHPDILSDIVASYKLISDDKFKGTIIKSPKKNQTASLIFYKYSNIDIDENAAMQLITDNLDWLFNVQDIGSSMILELYTIQTQITAEIIYFISSYYEDAYLIKPSIIPEISDRAYLVLTKLKKIPEFSLPKHSKNTYLASIGIKNMSNDFITTLQCFNSEVMPRKYRKYSEIKAYIDSQVYEGAVYQEMRDTQNDNAIKWLDTFTKNSKDQEKLLDKILKKTGAKCLRHGHLITLLNK